jgi:hypothetical protein
MLIAEDNGLGGKKKIPVIKSRDTIARVHNLEEIFITHPSLLSTTVSLWPFSLNI